MDTCNISIDLTSFTRTFMNDIENISKISDVKELKREYLKALRLLKSQYSNRISEDEFFDAILHILNGFTITMLMLKPENGQLKSILFNADGSVNTYRGDLSSYDPYFVESTLDIESKFDNFDTTESEKNEKEAMKESILALYFPMSSDARLAFELRFKRNIVKRFFFNDNFDTPRVNLSNSLMDKSVKSYRNELENILDTYVENNFPQDLNVFKQYSIKSKLDYINNALNNGNLTISSIELVKIATLDLLNDGVLKQKLLTYMAYIALKHYDEMISNAFGDSITILYKGNYNTDLTKYRINLGNRAATTWNDESKDIDETELIGSVIRLYMESLDMYSPTNGAKLPVTLTFSDVKSGLGGIMNLFNYYDKGLLRNFELDSLVDPLNDLKEANLDKFYNGELENLYFKYVKGKTIGLLIAKTKRDPALLAPILFTILAKNADNFFDKRYQTKLAVYSIWKNIFDLSNDSKESLLNRTINSGGINLDAADLYSFVTTLLVNVENIPVIEYRSDKDKGISIIELQENTSNSRLNSLKYTWAGKYNIENVQLFNNFTIDDFKNDSPVTKITLNDDDLVLEVAANGNRVNTILRFKNGAQIDSINELNALKLAFLSEVFDKQLDNDFLDIYKSLGGQIKELFNLAGTILYNYKVGKTVALRIKLDKAKNSEKSLRAYYDEEIEKFYTQNNAPAIMRDVLLPELFDSSVYLTVKRYSQALDIQAGYSGDTVAKDGSGKQIALMGLSSLMSKYMELVYNNNLDDEESILKDFTIYNTFENAYFIRDFASPSDKKQANTFSEAEFFAASFLYDFYGGLVAVKEGKQSDLRIIGTSDLSTKFFVMGPVVSDKNKLPKLQFDWLSKVEKLTREDGTPKRYLDLTVEDILQLQNLEFGDYYEGVYNRIHKDWNNLQPYISKYVPNAVMDFDLDFETFNLQCADIGENPFNVIHKAVADYLTHARINGLNAYGIRIIHNFHYIEGKDGQIHNNPSLFHQLSIYGRKKNFKVRTNSKYLPNLDTKTLNETPEQARRRLNLQLISELLQYDIRLHYGLKDSNVIDNASYAAETFNSEDWRNGKTIYFAKILDGNKTINLQSLNSFKSWSRYQDLVETLGTLLPKDLDISSPKFNLGKTISILNDIKKYRTLLMTSAKRILNSKYKKELEKRLKGSSYEELITNIYLKNYPTWKPETIQRKVKEKLNSFETLEDKQNYIINDIINELVNLYIIKRAKGQKTNSSFNDDYSLLLKAILDENSEDDTKLKDRIASQEIDLQINPEVERYLALNNWLGESYMLTSVGSFIAHPGNKNASTIYEYEYGNFGLQVKRNVSQTATKHREVQNSLKGIRSKLRIALVNDIIKPIITYKGDYQEKGVDVHNGATWYNGTMVDLDNNSLGADAMGQTKKPFIHAIDPKTGCAIIVKTAGFAVTNDLIRGSETFARLNKHMNHRIKWTDSLRSIGDLRPYFNWLTDFNDNPLHIDDWYVQLNGKFYKCSNPKIDSWGNTTVDFTSVDKFGEAIGTPITYTFGYSNGKFIPIRKFQKSYVDLDGKKITGNPVFLPINSNWELWNVFGGANSAHLNSDKIVSNINDSGSFQKLNYVMNHTGVVTGNLTISLTNVFQVIKESQIDMIPTMEATKFGAANINSTNLFEDDNYPITYMEVSSEDFGEQLDAEHTAEGGHVSLMTLVINALGARGYSRLDAEECYQALESLAEQAYEEAFELLERGNDLDAFKTAIANIMLQTFKNTSISDGNILSAISQGLKRFQRFNNPSELEGVFPVSSPLIYAKAFSKFASALEKSSIRLKFDGGMLVLNPSDHLVQIINGKVAGNVSKLEVEILQQNAYNNPLTSSSEIKIGRYYYLIQGLGEQTPIEVNNIEDFYLVKNAIDDPNIRVIEAVQEGLSVVPDNTDLNLPNKTKIVFSHYKPIGRDLAPYDCVFGNSTNLYNLYETDIVKLLFAWNDDTKTFKTLENVPLTNLQQYWEAFFAGNTEIEPLLMLELNKFGITEINPNRMKAYLQQSLQKTLDSISKGIRSEVLVNGVNINIDKSKTKVSPYEAVLPMIYKTTFGLKEGDSIGEIEADSYFFVKRFIDKSRSKFYQINNIGEYSVNGSSFDLELKRTSGEHLYLARPDKRIFFETEVPIISEIVGDVMYRVDENDNRMYLLPTKIENGILVPNCKIVKAFNGVEVIKTDDFSTILESEHYNSISFGDFSNTKDEDLLNILIQLEESDNKIAKAKAAHVLSTVNRRVNNAREGVKNNIANYNIIANDAELVEALLNAPERYNSISEIFSDKFGLNSFKHAEIYRNDATNQDLTLQKLNEAIQTNSLDTFVDEDSWYEKVINYGLELHTSFLTSLEAVVSRTPAQSHQSFMAMKVAAFDNNITNSIYVNRMLLFLLGSDF